MRACPNSRGASPNPLFTLPAESTAALREAGGDLEKAASLLVEAQRRFERRDPEAAQYFLREVFAWLARIYEADPGQVFAEVPFAVRANFMRRLHETRADAERLARALENLGIEVTFPGRVGGLSREEQRRILLEQRERLRGGRAARRRAGEVTRRQLAEQFITLERLRIERERRMAEEERARAERAARVRLPEAVELRPPPLPRLPGRRIFPTVPMATQKRLALLARRARAELSPELKARVAKIMAAAEERERRYGMVGEEPFPVGVYEPPEDPELRAVAEEAKRLAKLAFALWKQAYVTGRQALYDQADATAAQVAILHHMHGIQPDPRVVYQVNFVRARAGARAYPYYYRAMDILRGVEKFIYGTSTIYDDEMKEFVELPIREALRLVQNDPRHRDSIEAWTELIKDSARKRRPEKWVPPKPEPGYKMGGEEEELESAFEPEEGD